MFPILRFLFLQKLLISLLLLICCLSAASTASAEMNKNDTALKPEAIALGIARQVHEFFLKRSLAVMKKPPMGGGSVGGFIGGWMAYGLGAAAIWASSLTFNGSNPENGSMPSAMTTGT